MTASARTTHHPAKLAIDLGFRPIPLGNGGDPKAPNRCDWQNPTRFFRRWRPHEGVGLACGLQPDGTYLNVVDYDHKPELGIDAPFYFNAALNLFDTIKVVTARSTSGKGRYILFKSKKEILSGTIRGEHGQKIGDFLGVGSQVVMPTPERMLQGTLADVPVLEDAEVDTLLEAVGYTRSQDETGFLELDWTTVEQYLGNIDGLLRRVKPHTLTYQHLHGDGNPNRSDRRYGVACELRRRFGYPNEEIAAILFHFNWGHLEEKGTRWLTTDIDRCISKANDRYPDILTNPSRCFKPQAAPIPHVERRRKGRPTRLTTHALLDSIVNQSDCGKLIQTQAELAKLHKVSVPTIRRLEKKLSEQGLIERQTVRKGRQSYSYVVVFSAIKNTDQHVPHNLNLVRSENQETAQQNDVNDAHNVAMVEHTWSEGTEARVPLADAVRTVRAAGAKTRKQVHRMLATYFTGHSWNAAAIDRHFDAQRDAERLQRTIVRETAKIRAATPQELRRWARSYAWQHQAAHKRGNERQAYMWGCREFLVNEEIERRRKAGVWTRERRRAPLADPPEVVIVQNLHNQPPSLSPPGGVCSSQLPAAEESPTVRIVQPWRYAAEARKRAAEGVCHD
jgi:hypothetical protein